MMTTKTKTITIVDDGGVYDISCKDEFKDLLASLKATYLEHVETKRRVLGYLSMQDGGKYTPVCSALNTTTTTATTITPKRTAVDDAQEEGEDEEDNKSSSSSSSRGLPSPQKLTNRLMLEERQESSNHNNNKTIPESITITGGTGQAQLVSEPKTPNRNIHLLEQQQQQQPEPQAVLQSTNSNSDQADDPKPTIQIHHRRLGPNLGTSKENGSNITPRAQPTLEDPRPDAIANEHGTLMQDEEPVATERSNLSTQEHDESNTSNNNSVTAEGLPQQNVLEDHQRNIHQENDDAADEDTRIESQQPHGAEHQTEAHEAQNELERPSTALDNDYRSSTNSHAANDDDVELILLSLRKDDCANDENQSPNSKATILWKENHSAAAAVAAETGIQKRVQNNLASREEEAEPTDDNVQRAFNATSPNRKISRPNEWTSPNKGDEADEPGTDDGEDDDVQRTPISTTENSPNHIPRPKEWTSPPRPKRRRLVLDPPENEEEQQEESESSSSPRTRKGFTLTEYLVEAKSLLDKGNYRQAMLLYEKALPLQMAAFGQTDIRVAQTCFQMGRALRHLDRYAEAMQKHQLALEIRKEILRNNKNDSRIADSHNAIAAVFHDQGQYSKAMDAYQEALGIRLELFGSRHVHVAQVLFNMGWISQKQTNYKQARKSYQQALCIYQKVHGEDHKLVQATRNQIAQVNGKLNSKRRSMVL